MVLLFVLITVDPELARLFLVRDHFLEALNPIVKLSLGHLARLDKTGIDGLERSHLVGHFIQTLVEILNLLTPLVK